MNSEGVDQLGAVEHKTRLQILRGAAQLFHQRGYGDVSIRDIASVCGVSSSTLYHHFADKREILFAITERFMIDFNAATREAAARGTSSPDRLRLIVVEHILFQNARRDDLLTGHHFRVALADAQRVCVLRLMRDYRETVQAIIVAGIGDGSFTVDDPRHTVVCILDMLNGVREWFSASGPASIDAIAARYAETALRLCGAHGPVTADAGDGTVAET